MRWHARHRASGTIDPSRWLAVATESREGFPEIQRHFLIEVADGLVVRGVHEADLVDNLPVPLHKAEDSLFLFVHCLRFLFSFFIPLVAGKSENLHRGMNFFAKFGADSMKTKLG